MSKIIKYLTFIFLILCSLNAQATFVDMFGTISFSRVGNVVNLQVSNIQNTDFFFTSGTLHLRMSATTTPNFSGSAYLLADLNLSYINGTGQLSPGESFIGINANTTFTPPPNGTYYIHMYVSEFPDLFTALDFHTFSSTETFGPVVVFPSAPTGLSVTSTTSSTINLNWLDNSRVENGYKIERSISPTSGFVQVATVGANISTYSATGLLPSTTYYFRVRAYNTAGNSAYSNTAIGFTSGATSSSIVSAVLPVSRSVQVGTTATAFASVINTGAVTATACSIAPLTSVAANFSYQTTDPSTNALVGTPNTPVDIFAGGLQTYLFAFTPTNAFNPTDVELAFDCFNTDPAPVTTGLNTLLLSASNAPVPDVVALAATPTGDGIVKLPGIFGSNAFAVASVNVGASSSITVTADTGDAPLPIALSVCETNPGTGLCLAPPANSVASTINAGTTPTFAIFVNGNGLVPLDPAGNRIIVEFRDGDGVVRGSTSVAVRTQ